MSTSIKVNRWFDNDFYSSNMSTCNYFWIKLSSLLFFLLILNWCQYNTNILTLSERFRHIFNGPTDCVAWR